MNTSYVLQLLPYALGCGAVVILFFLLLPKVGLWTLKLRVRNLSKFIAKDIVKQSSWNRRQRWVSEDTIEFIYLIFTKQEPGHHLLWAKVSKTMISMQVRIQYSPETEKYDLLHAKKIAHYLRVYNVDVILDIIPSNQPDLDEMLAESED